ncbi:uncharacterized protein TRAVEDRAFT_20142 [Trametes versicolor FP-101664 SS1]|uniref:uncharacterized protein n=1 Tax=Trametes versicolor (strain FP-101664) TaxID=717944 RepID=UPI00046234C0|nr:uncharacterized protein TRAVEDRAFT_20142 [Trametes versicolor FP-101664 SS1]EIW59865.1 hypothetical protein TRAVEDRAFT_20142 [Trametes versicolor FP-101664 SS1]
MAMPPIKKRKVAHANEGHKDLGALPSHEVAPVLAARPVLWGLPFDVIRIIALEMHLQDLYNLSQACKNLRSCLWSKDAETLWKAVIKKNGHQPSLHQPPPPFLKIPAYVHLACSTHCSNCGAPGAEILRKWVVRMCPACLRYGSAAIVWYGDAAKQMQSLNSDISENVLEHATLAQYFFVLDPSNDKTNEKKNLLLRRDVTRVVERFKELGSAGSNDAMETFVNAMKDDFESQQNYSRGLDIWLELRRIMKRSQDREMRRANASSSKAKSTRRQVT